MILYIGEGHDEAFVNEISKGVTDEIRMVTNVHTIAELAKTAKAIPSTHLVINIQCIQENPSELIKQLKYIQLQVNNNLIIIASGLMTNDPMIQSLYFAGLKNVIITSWFPTIAEECIKYLSGAYQGTELLQQESQQESQETARLDLKQIYQDDPVILQQLEELERQNASVEEQNQTVKLSPEELFPQDRGLAEQVSTYEEEQSSEQSTTLYQEKLSTVSEAREEVNPYEQQYLSSSPVYPYENGVQESFSSYQKPQALSPSNPSTNFPQYAQEQKESQQKRTKKIKRPVLLTVSLCAVLAISIIVPVVCTRLHNAKKDAAVEERLSETGMSYGAESEITQSPEATPEQIVLGAETEEATDFVEPTGEMPEETSAEETSLPEESPLQEETAITLTPIKANEKEDQESEQTVKPEKTARPAKTEKPTSTPVPVNTVQPTRSPAPVKTPKATKAPLKTKEPKPKEIKITSIVLPDKVYVLKGGSYKIDMSYSPSNATESVSWSSSNSKIASINNGILKAKKAGKATITVRSKSGKKRTCKVIVSEE